MFRRHCFVAEAAVNWPEEWILFVDADIGVINPSHLIEDYLPRNNSIDVLFYKRIFNHEVMAGSYMFRYRQQKHQIYIFFQKYSLRSPILEILGRIRRFPAELLPRV